MPTRPQPVKARDIRYQRIKGKREGSGLAGGQVGFNAFAKASPYYQFLVTCVAQTKDHAYEPQYIHRPE